MKVERRDGCEQGCINHDYRVKRKEPEGGGRRLQRHSGREGGGAKHARGKDFAHVALITRMIYKVSLLCSALYATCRPDP